MNKSDPIYLNRATGKIQNAGPVEWLGINSMSLGAKLTKLNNFVGYSWIARLIRLILPSKRTVVLQYLSDTKFSHPYGDLYWSRLADTKSIYSPDMENFLAAISHVDYAFLDCGANFGLLSALVTSDDYGNKPSFAVEADPETFQYLQKNSQLNNSRFEVVNKAIFSRSGETVNIYGDKHEARSIKQEANASAVNGNIETVAPDDLLPWLKKQGKKLIILKLDIEGVEIEALKGSIKLLEKDCLVYYEDHGSEKEHEISQFIKNELGLKIYFPDNYGKCQAITDLKQLSAIKKNSRIGYDFVATKRKIWLDELEKLTR